VKHSNNFFTLLIAFVELLNYIEFRHGWRTTHPRWKRLPVLRLGNDRDANGLSVVPRADRGGVRDVAPQHAAVEHQRFIERFSSPVKSQGDSTGAGGRFVSDHPLAARQKVIESLRTEISKTKTVKGNVLDAVDQTRGSAEEAARMIKDI